MGNESSSTKDKYFSQKQEERHDTAAPKQQERHDTTASKQQERHDTTAKRKQRTTNQKTETLSFSELSDAVKAHHERTYFTPKRSSAAQLQHIAQVQRNPLRTSARSTVSDRYRSSASMRRNVPTTKPKPSQQRINLVIGPNLSSQQGSNTTTTKQQERCYDPKDSTLIFVDGEDDMDFEYNGYKSLRAKMSCGHTVTPSSLMDWCQRLLDRGETRFVCGVCPAEWPREEVYKMALMTPEETDQFDRTLFKTAIPDLLGAKACPGCKSLVVWENLNNLRVRCTKCTADKGRDYEFCWQCLKEWKRPSPYPDRCAEDGCTSPLEILRTCAEIKFKDVKNVTGCPSVRACPTCGLLIEHNSKACKNITCGRCKVKFCFVCLKLTYVCSSLEPYSCYLICRDGVAPRQTAIPVWKQK